MSSNDPSVSIGVLGHIAGAFLYGLAMDKKRGIKWNVPHWLVTLTIKCYFVRGTFKQASRGASDKKELSLQNVTSKEGH